MIRYGIKYLLQQQAVKQPKLPQMDKALYQWYTAMHSEEKSLTWTTIIGKADVFLWWHENNWQVHILLWLSVKFKEHHGIRELDISGEMLPADAEDAQQLSELFHNLVEEHKLLSNQPLQCWSNWTLLVVPA